jgi:hypothetical protein
MTITRLLLAQIRELMGRGMKPLAIAQSMAMGLDEVDKLIYIVRHS